MLYRDCLRTYEGQECTCLKHRVRGIWLSTYVVQRLQLLLKLQPNFSRLQRKLPCESQSDMQWRLSDVAKGNAPA